MQLASIRKLGLSLTLVGFGLSAACSGTIGDANGGPGGSNNDDDSLGGGDTYEPVFPFEAVGAHTYVSKVKNLLTGLPATDEEVASVTADPAELRAMVDTWFKTPEAKAKFLALYGNMFQQNNVVEQDLSPLIGSRGLTGFADARMVANVEESFPRTVAAVVENREPFSSTVTTKTVYMTTALLSLYLMNDTFLAKDKENQKISRNVNYNATVSGKVRGGDATDGSLRLFFYYDDEFNTLAPAGSDAATVAAAVDAQRAIYEENVTNKASPNFMRFPMATRYSCTIPDIETTDTGAVPKGYVKRNAGVAVRIQHYLDSNLMVNIKSDLVDGKETGTYGNNAELKVFERLFNGGVQGIVANLNDARTATKPKPISYPVVPVIPIPAGDTAPTRGPDYKIDCGFSWSDTRVVAGNDTRNVAKPYARDTDYTDWRAVTIIQDPNGDSTPFYNLPALRGKTTVRLRTPKTGFFSTPAFQATYPSNDSNQARGIVNQALIVAIGKSINPVDKGSAVVLDFGNQDAEHSNPDSPCFTCHRSLDPMREIMQSTWSNTYAQQTETKELHPKFDYLGVNVPLATIEDFGNALASHPLYASAVAQTLCYYANSAACTEQDEEFKRVVQAFVDSNYDFAALVGDMFSSPLVTGASRTRTWEDRGEVISISRYNHLCNSLTTRLGLTTNACSINTLLATVIAADGFARGAEAPTLSTDPTLFYRSAVEQLCIGQSTRQIDATGGKYVSSKKDEALASFVSDIAGISAADPAYSDIYGIVSNHYDKALADAKNTGNASQKATQALRSAFILACTAPTSMTIGL